MTKLNLQMVNHLNYEDMIQQLHSLTSDYNYIFIEN